MSDGQIKNILSGAPARTVLGLIFLIQALIVISATALTYHSAGAGIPFNLPSMQLNNMCPATTTSISCVNHSATDLPLAIFFWILFIGTDLVLISGSLDLIFRPNIKFGLLKRIFLVAEALGCAIQIPYFLISICFLPSAFNYKPVDEYQFTYFDQGVLIFGLLVSLIGVIISLKLIPLKPFSKTLLHFGALILLVIFGLIFNFKAYNFGNAMVTGFYQTSGTLTHNAMYAYSPTCVLPDNCLDIGVYLGTIAISQGHGNTWHVISSFGSYNPNDLVPVKLLCLSESKCLGIFSSEDIADISHPTNATDTLEVSSDFGRSWKVIYTVRQVFTIDNSGSGLGCFDKDTCWAFLGGKLLLSQNAGVSFRSVKLTGYRNVPPDSISCVSDTLCLLTAGFSLTYLYYGSISSDTWQVQQFGGIQASSNPVCFKDKFCFVVDDNIKSQEIYFEKSNADLSDFSVVSTLPMMHSYPVAKLSCFTSFICTLIKTDCFAPGNCYVDFYVTTNAGVTWSLKRVGESNVDPIAQFSCFGASNCVINYWTDKGALIATTDNLGNTFDIQHFPRSK
jgi:hypothetical protein